MKGNDFYKTYQTTEWQRKKNSVLERDDYTCQICGSSSGIMQVHHITYKHCHGKAYNAPMGDLITLCEHCHSNDDGDHEHFFNGQYHLIAMSNPHLPPLVIDLEEEYMNLKWDMYCRGHIYRFYMYGDRLCVGYFTETYCEGSCAWFPFLQGCKDKDDLFVFADHDFEDVARVRSATHDEVEAYITLVENYIQDFRKHVMRSGLGYSVDDTLLGNEYKKMQL